MVLASLREPGEFGGLAPWTGTSLEAYRFLVGDVIYAEIFLRSFGVAALTTLICLVLAYPLAWLIATQPEEAARPARAAGHPALRQQLPDPHLRLDHAASGRSTCSYTPIAVMSAWSMCICRSWCCRSTPTSRQHDPALLEAAQRSRRRRLGALLAHHLPAVAARHLRRLGAGVHSGASACSPYRNCSAAPATC